MKKTWRIVAIRQIRQSFLPAKVLFYTVVQENMRWQHSYIVYSKVQLVYYYSYSATIVLSILLQLLQLGTTTATIATYIVQLLQLSTTTATYVVLLLQLSSILLQLSTTTATTAT